MWNTVFFSTPCESSLKVNRYVFIPLIIYNLKLTYICIYIHTHSYLTESLICTFSYFSRKSKCGHDKKKKKSKVNLLKRSVGFFSHSCMAETCKNNVVN